MNDAIEQANNKYEWHVAYAVSWWDNLIEQVYKNRGTPPASQELEEDETQHQEVEAKAKAVAQEERSQKEWEAVQQFAVFGIGPPIALLVLGFAIRWIIAGFRQPKK